MEQKKRKVGSIEAFLKGLDQRRVATYAAYGAYYLFMSMTPIVILFVSILPYTPLTQDMLIDLLRRYVPLSMVVLVEQIVINLYRDSQAVLPISALLTLWSASSALRALMRGMDAVYDARRRDNYILFHLRAYFYMVILMLILLICLATVVYGGRILDFLRQLLPPGARNDFLFLLFDYLRLVLAPALLALCFSLLYKWMPARRVRYESQWPGALFTTFTWTAFSYFFSLYVGNLSKYGAYGFIGTVMITMMWMYYCLYFMLVGGYLNARLALRRREKQAEPQKVRQDTTDFGSIKIPPRPAGPPAR